MNSAQGLQSRYQRCVVIMLAVLQSRCQKTGSYKTTLRRRTMRCDAKEDSEGETVTISTTLGTRV